ncbi:HepT-like ribonuclease domain-containing protein [Falsiroseomonas sp.]|uniref:HepT-like ribonuclease domain-containing protein n=1 Tax=Falsiroseomonas sp. TaxID=2870721 RepID=UPI003F6F41F7
MTRTPRDDAALLRDLFEAAQAALRFAEGLDEAAFLRSELHQQAIIRVVAIVGEVAWRMTPGFKAAHPDIPWQAMAGMRHRIVHDYADVDLDLVWRVVVHELPPLVSRLRALFPRDGGA